MASFIKFAAATAALGFIAAPAAAQYGQYQQPYPQQAYPQQAYPGYAQPYGQSYAQNPVGQIIDQLLGNRYNVTDRTAVSQCASAAMAQASAQYGGGYNQGYNQGYNNGYGNAYGNGYNRGYSNMRVTSITDVQRRNNGLRVSGLMSSGYGGQYGNQYGYQNRGYGELSFRCNVDYRGAVTNIRIRPYNGYNH
jgi:hypothetical protein